jgi:hypothetical protein
LIANTNSNGELRISSLRKFQSQHSFYRHKLSLIDSDDDGNNEDAIDKDIVDDAVVGCKPPAQPFSMKASVLNLQTARRLESVAWDPGNENAVACTSASPFVEIYDLLYTNGEPCEVLKDSEFLGDLYDLKFAPDTGTREIVCLCMVDTRY